MSRWSPLHTALLVIGFSGLFLAVGLGRYRQLAAEEWRDVAFQRFRITLAVAGVGGLLALIRLWFLSD